MLLAAAAVVLAIGAPDDVFDLGRDRIREVVVTQPGDVAPGEMAPTPMLRAIQGVVGVIDASDARRLAGTSEELWRVDQRPLVATLCTLHLRGAREERALEVHVDAEGRLIVRSDGESGHIRLDRALFTELSREWIWCTASIHEPVPEREGDGLNQSIMLEQPYVPAPVTLDAQTLEDRFYGRLRLELPEEPEPTERQLADETLFVRFPDRYDPRLASGLVVWVNSDVFGHAPIEFHEGLDELGLICVGASGAGYERPLMDRLQLALDAVETMRTRYNIDAERVYVAGLSGGGRAGSQLWGTFPEVFKGAIAIVGLDSYHITPRAGRTAWPAAYAKPRGDRWRQLHKHRLAAITGDQDVNRTEIERRIDRLASDGLDVRVDRYGDMAHTLPLPGRFRDALMWVDEPARQRRLDAEREAEDVLARLQADEKIDARSRRALISVIETAPWSRAAWEAAALLGYTD